MSFSELNLSPAVVGGLENAGFTEPTAIQSQIASPALAGRDVIGLAPTGTGKTLAYLAPIVHHLLNGEAASGGAPRALVLCPTRELAQQAARDGGIFLDPVARAKRNTPHESISIGAVFGGVGINPQAAMLTDGLDILAATPGRARDLIEMNALHLEDLQHVVIDEADRLLDMGFLPQVEAILNRLPRGVQRLLLTATMPPGVERLARSFLHKPVRIEIGTHTRPAKHVEQHRYPVADHLKSRLLLHLLEDSAASSDDESSRRRSAHDEPGGVLIFCRTRRRAGWVAAALKRHDISVGVVHGDRSQAQRERALRRFAAGELRAIVATDVAARGLHIEAVGTVINYDLPLRAEEYVHRVGRAGHASDYGEAWSFIAPEDEERWQTIARIVRIDLKPEFVEGFDYDEPPRGRPGQRDRRTQTRDRAKNDRRKPRRRGSKSAGRDEAPRAGKRGNLKRRGAAKRPIGKGEKPGRGVKRPGSN